MVISDRQEKRLPLAGAMLLQDSNQTPELLLRNVVATHIKLAVPPPCLPELLKRLAVGETHIAEPCSGWVEGLEDLAEIAEI